jgi:hypothetical protein
MHARTHARTHAHTQHHHHHHHDPRGSAHTTAANYLWARVPVVTLPGQHIVSRVAASLLMALSRDTQSGCSALTLARSEDDYVAVGRALAKAAAPTVRAPARGDTLTDSSDLRAMPSPSDAAGSAAQAAYARFRRCLRAATEPLDALSETGALIDGGRQGRTRGGGGGGAERPPGMRDAAAGSTTSATAVFDTGRWVRDWERALSLVVELALASSCGGGAGGDRGSGGRFSVIVAALVV